MKTFLLMSILAFLFFQGFSQDKGKLTFFSEDGKKFWVIINGEKINQEPQYNVKDIPVDFQWGKVVIIFEDSNLPKLDKTVQMVSVDNYWMHVKYMIKKKKTKYNIVQSAWEPLKPFSDVTTTTTTTTQTPAQTSQTTTQTTTNQTPAVTTQTQVQTQPNTTNTSNTQTTNFSQTTNMSPTGVSTTVVDPVTGETINMSIGLNITGTGTATTTQSQTVTTTTTTTTSGGTIEHRPNQVTNPQIQEKPKPVENKPTHYVMPGYNGKIGCPWPMQQNDFSDAKNSINSKTFEDSKLTIAKQVTSNNCLTCSQVKEIMALLTFEDSKLTFAKFAYDYVYDLNNYYKLNDAFTFESSIDELNNYVNSKK